ncbi:hypothetical protein, partial [Endothiovibrio diazotrophicus]
MTTLNSCLDPLDAVVSVPIEIGGTEAPDLKAFVAFDTAVPRSTIPPWVIDLLDLFPLGCTRWEGVVRPYYRLTVIVVTRSKTT